MSIISWFLQGLQMRHRGMNGMDLSVLSAFPNVADCIKTMILARPDYREAARQTREWCINLALNALPTKVKGRLFSSYATRCPFYEYIAGLKDAGSSEPYLRPGALLGSDQKWWQEFAIGLVAQAILDGTKLTAKRLSQEKVKKYLEERETQLDQFAYLVYTEVYIRDIDWRLKRAWHEAQFLGVEEAARQYSSVLKSSITMHNIWAASGMWPDSRQEIYHHYIKLTSLYIAPTRIDTMIQELKTAGMDIPSELDAGVWHQYNGFHDFRAWLTAADILPFCKEALNETRLLPRQGWWDVRLDPIWIQEYYAVDFFEQYCADFR